MIANPTHPALYENVSLVIDAFEKAALRSGTREGAMVVANNPLTGMDQMLEGSDNVLAKVSASRTKSSKGKGTKKNDALRNLFDPDQDGETGIGVSYDADLADLLGGGAAAKAIDNYLEECLGCDLRLTFDWQLKPLNLLGGIDSLIEGIEDILDQFKMQLNEFKVLDGLCSLLDLLKGLCIPDLISILLALKLLLKRYISEAINIRLDWTMILGPLLKWILESIGSLLEQLGGVILAPLDCALNVLYTANELERETRELAGMAQALGEATADTIKAVSKGELPPGMDIDTMAEDFTWGGSTVGEATYPDAPNFGWLSSTAREINAGDGLFSASASGNPLMAGGSASLTIPTGFRLTKDTQLEDALRNPSFGNSTITEKLIVPVQEAKRYIEDLIGMIIKSVRSLQALVSGGFRTQMGTLGIIMFIKDMIQLVMMIVKLLNSHRNIPDWCTYLEENPHLLEEGMRDTFGRSAARKGAREFRVETGEDHTLILSEGPKMIGTIKTCLTERSTRETELLGQWIQDLKRKGVN